MSRLLKEYHLGDMVARYVTDKKHRSVGLVLIPANAPYPQNMHKDMGIDSIVQLKIVGDTYDGAYAQGMSMRNGESVRRLNYKNQESSWKKDKFYITTYMEDERGYLVNHTLIWRRDTSYIRIFCGFTNHSQKDVKIEMFESFSLSEISPYLEESGYGKLDVYRIRSVWSQEGRLEHIPVEDLQLEPAWSPHAVRCEKFGQLGSMPVNKFFPFVAIKDKEHNVFWGAQIAHPASWQIELYRKDDGLAVSGGLADRDFGHWMKIIRPGEEFITPEAIVSTAGSDSIDVFCSRLTSAAYEYLEESPSIEQDLPIIYNEYCSTWGKPSHETILDILKAIRGKGFSYFVIDCGWFKEPGVSWDISMGDYEVSKELFPQGLQATIDAIKEEGLIPGIWFEFENVGRAARSYHETEHLLKKDGEVITSYLRRFWDMRDPWVWEYLREKVIGTLKKYGFGYMKIDYNETIGIGCDGAESLGEGLRQNMQATIAFIEEVKREVPGIILENCASGGHRLEPQLMGLTSMASFSDAHECVEIPIIAAGLQRSILPCQSQIWAVIRKSDSLQRICYSIASTFLGRMCISGDVTELGADQWKLIKEGMQFYKKVVPIIKKGQSYQFGSEINSTRHPTGWQAVLRIGENTDAYMVIHTFGGELPEKIEIPLLDEMDFDIKSIYSHRKEKIHIKDRKIIYKSLEAFSGVVVYLAARK